jgi:hypothetical protein
LYKTIVISGESGVGKTCCAVNRIAELIRKDLPTSSSNNRFVHVVTIYCKASYNDNMREQLKAANEQTDKASRNHLCKDILKIFWQENVSYIEKKYPVMLENRELWKQLKIVFVIDELGGYPNVVRGLVSIGLDLQKELLGYNEGLPEIVVNQFQLVLVGTALAYHVADQDSIASDRELFQLFHILNWNRISLTTYMNLFLKYEGMTGIGEIVSGIPILAVLGTNARCANFLASYLDDMIKEIKARCKTVDSIGNVIRKSAEALFIKVATRYRQANGIGYVANYHKEDFDHAILLLLKFSLNMNLDDGDSEWIPKLLIYGMLTYDMSSKKFNMSPVMLLLALSSSFGYSDIFVKYFEDFEELVALRELVKLHIEYPTLDIQIINLKSPIPHTRANSSMTAGSAPKCSYNLNFSLPPGKFCVEDNEDSKLLVLKNSNQALILINGPKAAAPDVFVIHRDFVKFMQMKLYEQGYYPNAESLNDELQKLGIKIDSEFKYPATVGLLQCLAGKRTIHRAFVTSNANGIILQSSYEDACSNDKRSANVVNEVLETVWQQLVLYCSESQEVFNLQIQIDGQHITSSLCV